MFLLRIPLCATLSNIAHARWTPPGTLCTLSRLTGPSRGLRTPSVPSPVAPFTGKIELPLDALQSLARVVVGNLHMHVLQSMSVENADESETWETDPDNAMDTQVLLSHVDPLRWKCIVERNGADPDGWSQASLQEFNDNSLTAQMLLNLGQTKAQGPMVRGCALRKATRGVAPEDDKKWAREDALLDLLVFLAQPGHEGLFKLA